MSSRTSSRSRKGSSGLVRRGWYAVVCAVFFVPGLVAFVGVTVSEILDGRDRAHGV